MGVGIRAKIAAQLIGACVRLGMILSDRAASYLCKVFARFCVSWAIRTAFPCGRDSRIRG